MKKNKDKQPEEQWIQLKQLGSFDKVYAANLDDNQLMYGDQQGAQKNANIATQSNPKPKVQSKVDPKVNPAIKQSDPKPQTASNMQYQQQPNQPRQQGINQHPPKNVKVQNPYNQQQKSSNQYQQGPRSKIPMMKVACDHCTLQQNVPGNAQIYACSACNNINECYPLYGIFICGTCKAQVCYGFGTSQFIRCTRCGMVNRVPSQPIFKYKGNDKPKKKVQTKQVSQKQKRQQQIIKIEKSNSKPLSAPAQQKMKVEEVDFFADQVAQMPQKPGSNRHGEQLLKQQIKYDELNEVVFNEEKEIYKERNKYPQL